MSQKDDAASSAGNAGLERLREVAMRYLGAQAQKLADGMGDKLTDMTKQLTSVADGGNLLKPGAQLLKKALPGMVAGKASDIKDKVVGTVTGGGGGGGTGGGRKAGSVTVTNIVETLDVGLPLRMVYDHWTQFDQFSDFMKGVTSVSKADEITSDWKVKVFKSNRSWKATTEEQIPDQRIVWNSEGGRGITRGVVSFHEIGPRLTRLVVVVEYYPSGFFEKTANIWRAPGRRLRLDLKHFQRHITLLSDDELEGWRGEIRDGEVVRSHEDAVEEERKEKEEEKRKSEEEQGAEEGDQDERGDEDRERGEDDEDEADEDDEDEDDEDEDEEDEDEEDEDEEEAR